jgi:hypothetical protein
MLNRYFKEDCLKNAAVTNKNILLTYLIKDRGFIIHMRIFAYLFNERYYETFKFIIKICDKIGCCETNDFFHTKIENGPLFLGLSEDILLVIITNKNKKIKIDVDSLISGAVGSGNLEFIK